MTRYVLITGATGGLGKAFAAECASRGWSLFLTDVSEQALDDLSRGLARMYSVRVLHLACDLMDAEAREVLWRQIDRLGLRFHMLINVAGLDHEGPFDERQVCELTAIVRLNIESTIEMTRRVLPYRAPEQTLRIINVSSLAAFYPMPVKAVYAASKRFLLDWSLALRQELRGQDITVTALCPAGMPTNPGTIRAIEAQGFMGRVTTTNVGDVAAMTINRAQAGRHVVVPGAANQALRFLGSMLPPSLVALLINRRWQKSHQDAHSPGLLAARGEQIA